jgi:hypothetical protein
MKKLLLAVGAVAMVATVGILAVAVEAAAEQAGPRQLEDMSVKELQEEMNDCVSRQCYEQAAVIRDIIQAKNQQRA